MLINYTASASPHSTHRSILFKTYTPDKPDPLEKLKGDLKYYRGMKATGAGLTGLGVAFFAAGQGMFWTSVALNQTGARHYTPTARDPLWLAGLGTTLLTAVPLAFGVPLLKYGTKKVKSIKEELRKCDAL